MTNLVEIALSAGATGAGIAKVSDIKFSQEFRAACEQNVCGRFGTCWMCPPDVGDINEMIAHAKTFENILVFQSIGQLEDSYDFEGMADAATNHNKLVTALSQKLTHMLENPLILGAGACHVCPRCTKLDSLPCAFPSRAIPSLEAYGISVADLAKLGGLNYMNGQNTVTYFGGILWN